MSRDPEVEAAGLDVTLARLQMVRQKLFAALELLDEAEADLTGEEEGDAEGEPGVRCPRCGGTDVARGIRGVSVCGGCGANIKGREVVGG